MFHPEVTQQSIQEALAKRLLKKDPTYLNRTQADQYIDHFRSLFSADPDTGEMTQSRPYTVEEVNWIREQRLLCRFDFRYWVSTYAYIKSEQDRVVPFSPRIPQQMFLDIVADMEKEGIACMLQVLKARQLGMSRIVSLIILYRLLFYPHVNAVLASSNPDKTRLLADMLEFSLDRQPFFLVPAITSRRDAAKTQGMGEWLEFGNMDTGLTLQHGSQYSGIARGTTPTVVHLSELCEFLEPEDLVDSSLLPAMHDSPRTFLVLESTALGRGNWWYKKWLSSKLGWPERRSRLRPVFLPWFVGTDLYPNPTWIKARPVPLNHIFPPWVEDHAARAAEYVSTDPLLSKYLGTRWVMPPEQKWYYEVSRGEAIREGRLNKFLQEYPSNDQEAFQSTNISVFSTEIIIAHRDRTRTPLGVYGLLGPSDLVPARVSPHRTQIDPNQKPISIVYDWGTGYPLHFTLAPLRWHGWPTDSGLDKVYLWELPEQGELYSLGFDTSDGIGKDRTCIEGLRKGSIDKCAGQVCEFTTDKLNALDATPFLMAMSALYSTPNEEGFRQQVRVAIECKGNGDQTQNRMRMNGWTNFHPWMRIDGRKLDLSQHHKIGVFTNTWFRAGLMEFMLKMLRDMEIDVASPFFVQEMESLEGDEFKQSLKAAHGEYDDRFMALGFAVITLYQWESGRPDSLPKVRRATSRETRRYANWKPPAASSPGTL